MQGRLPNGVSLTRRRRRRDHDRDSPYCPRRGGGGAAMWHRWIFALVAVVTLAMGSTARAEVPLDHLPALKGGYFRLESKAVGRPFHIYVRTPEAYAGRPDATFPVVYLLDGDSLFPILAANHLFLHYDEGLPDAVVVGIAYGGFDEATNKRGVDFTGPAEDVESARAGAPAFQRFLKEELIPTVEGLYRVDPERRVLFGQSRGGSFVLYSAFTDPDLFWGRIASNPALDPGRERFFGPANPARRSDLGLVYVSGSRDRPRLRADALEWFAAWRERRDAPWAVRAVDLPGGTHAADAPNAYRAGLLWLFGRLAPTSAP